MRWWMFLILAYVAIGAHIGVRAFATMYGAETNLVLLAVIFITVNAPREPALVGAFLLGLLQDLMTVQPLGLWAFSYGVVGMFVISTQEVVYREHPLTHFSLALMGGLLTGGILFLEGWRHSRSISVGPLFISALYTAILSVPVLAALQRTRRLFGFEPSRRRARAWG